MDITPIVTRLKAQLAGFVQIGGAADLDAAIDNLPGVPAAFAMPLAELAEEPAYAGIHAQRIQQSFGVVLVVQNLRDVKGAAAQTDLQAKRLQVRNALAGWVPDAANGERVAFSGGRLLRFEQGRLWWTDEFRVMTDYWSA